MEERSRVWLQQVRNEQATNGYPDESPKIIAEYCACRIAKKIHD